MTEILPQFLDTESYAAKYDRQHWRDILSEGIVGVGDLEVTEKGTPDMSVDVASGSAYVQGDQSATQGLYRIYNDGTVNKVIAASDPTNARIDRVIAQIKDSTDIGGVDDEWEIQVLTGTPAGSPVAPALPDDALDLALIDVGNGVTTITDSDITDQRERIGFQNVSDRGWVSAGESWSYASASTITVPSGAASKYSVGMKIKITQTTDKFFYISAVADTVLTVNGAGLYTVANAAITSPYYSSQATPHNFPMTMIPGYVKCKVWLSADQTAIPNATVTDVEFDTEDYDIGSNFNTGTHTFTAPVSGYYRPNISLYIDDLDEGKQGDARIAVNGASKLTGRVVSGGADDIVVPSVSDLIYLDKDDAVKGTVYHNEGDTTPKINDATAMTYFSIVMESVL